MSVSGITCNFFDRLRCQATNDDLILQSCTRFQDRTRNLRDDQVRNTVLLTDDRNLRVKAMAVKMPTRSLQDFCKWASVS